MFVDFVENIVYLCKKITDSIDFNKNEELCFNIKFSIIFLSNLNVIYFYTLGNFSK